jgi:MOB kinase activator 1
MSFLQYITARTGLLVLSPPPAAPSPPPAWEEESEEEQENTIVEAYEPQWQERACADRHCDDSNARKARQRTLRGAPANGLALRQYAEATLGGGSLRKAVKLPEGEDEDEWLAVNSEFPE